MCKWERAKRRERESKWDDRYLKKKKKMQTCSDKYVRRTDDHQPPTC